MAVGKSKARFAIGQQYLSHGKHPNLCTVTDILWTYNNAGEFVGLRYVATHEFAGQTVTDRDVCETTIARAAVAPMPAEAFQVTITADDDIPERMVF